ncbi:MAG: glycosyltransferase family 4 protein [Sphaerospermopsis sp. SIO1G1]|nr:glycosyltransferase family 4 protein [Sphaerospermopsis sp. SIO1G1]
MWICSQLGAREHYAIPRAIHKNQRLDYLITDVWIQPQSPITKLPSQTFRKLSDRFHDDLNTANIIDFTTSLINFEISQRLQPRNQWETIINRNLWFQRKVLQKLREITPKLNTQPVLFSYSYTALDLLKYAKSQGWFTILGQIDPGLIEEKIVIEEQNKYPHNTSIWQPAPSKYWSNWQEECSLADKIIVNSTWSSKALQQVGISAEKINIVPLAYEFPKSAQTFKRIYPQSFCSDRPLRVLFLGQVVIRKGIMALLSAAKLLKNEPIEFWIVGSLGIKIPEPIQTLNQVRWFGAVPRSATDKFYQAADIFLFPTFSDGFGLTQLEAQAWKLPIIASRFCGEVVKEELNGLILPKLTPEVIAEALIFCLNHPHKLQTFADNSIQPSEYNLFQLQQHLQRVAYAVI